MLSYFTGETGIGKSTLMDTLFNTHFDSTPSTHDLPGVKLKASTYGKFWGFLFYGGVVKGLGDNNTVHNVNEHYILKDETIKEFGFYIYVGCFFTN